MKELEKSGEGEKKIKLKEEEKGNKFNEKEKRNAETKNLNYDNRKLEEKCRNGYKRKRINRRKRIQNK